MLVWKPRVVASDQEVANYGDIFTNKCVCIPIIFLQLAHISKMKKRKTKVRLFRCIFQKILVLFWSYFDFA